jgi:hypothetical protein
MNTYAYAFGNPVSHSDSTGELVGTLANPVGAGVAAGLGVCMLIPSCRQGIVDGMNTIRNLCSSDSNEDKCSKAADACFEQCQGELGKG